MYEDGVMIGKHAKRQRDFGMRVGSCKATPKHFYIVMDSMSRANLSRGHGDAIR